MNSSDFWYRAKRRYIGVVLYVGFVSVNSVSQSMARVARGKNMAEMMFTPPGAGCIKLLTTV